MQKQLKILVLALLTSSLTMAQTTDTGTQEVKATTDADETQFTFTESQLGEDDDMAQNVTIISSNGDLYASQVGYGFSAVRFRYRAFNQKYNDVFINGMQMNDMETGQFRFSLVGGLNNQTRSVESVLPFESNNFALAAMGGSNNYNFRAGSMASGHKASLLFTNRNYNMRAMYTYASGFNAKGWALAANITYRGATYDSQNWTKAYKGTFYNALSYFFGVQKLLGNHSLSFSTWGNPTERASSGASTDEMYWLANNNYYNPYWGYQNGKVRNSRIVNDFAPSAAFTWDWTISNKTKLTTTLGGKYSMYKSTKLNYNNADNPAPDYWKRFPSAAYDVFGENGVNEVQPWTYAEEFGQQVPAYWYSAYKALTGSEAARQINWDQLYVANQGANKAGQDAMYFIQAKRNDVLTMQLNSVLNHELSPSKHLSVGLGLGTNHARHYQTMEDMLGATSFHNINTYALSNYGSTGDGSRYDLNEGIAAKEVKNGDVFGYDYFINIRKANLWSSYTANIRRMHLMVGAKTSYTGMQRDGKMRNGLCKDYSYGKSDWANFLDGGVKGAMTMNLTGGHAVSLGVGAEKRAPLASTAFQAPEMNNNFVQNLHNENVFSSNLSYQFRSSWLNLNINGYYSRLTKVTEWQNYYLDEQNSFTYVSLTGIDKEYYGVEMGAKVRLTSTLDIKAFGTMSEAQYLTNANVNYMLSTSGTQIDDFCYSKGMRESGTPLTALSLGLSYHNNGWYIDLAGNYYDRVYLSWTPSTRYNKYLESEKKVGTVVDENGDLVTFVDSPAQQRGKGGFMLDGSIGRSIRIRHHGTLSINLSLTNILNNTKLCTGGYEQSRISTYTQAGSTTKTDRAYDFQNNPKKFYAYGTNGMLNLTWRF